MRPCVALLLALAVAAPVAEAGLKDKIKHVVVTMLENRSFDHVLGFLKRDNDEIDGLTGNEFNYAKAADPSSEKITVNSHAVYVDPDPGHSLEATAEQVFGSWPPPKDLPKIAPMDGFVQNAIGKKISGQSVMSMFNKTSLPVIHTLATEFAMFDHYFASVPGPTEVNRMFLHSATSNGSAFNDDEKLALGYPQETVYERLEKNNVTWGTYFSDVPTTLFFDFMRRGPSLERMKTFEQFKLEAEADALPQYTFLDPRYFDLLDLPAEDQHPSHDMSAGDRYIAKVYETLRNSPAWESTLLIITYDEHGGFFDHKPTPLTDIPNPDGLNSTDPPFNFTRLGVRVPAILVSPWIPKGTLVHAPPTGQYEHSSIVKTIFEILGVPGHLTKRDEWAASMTSVISLDTPRDDCPKTLPTTPNLRRVYSSSYPMSDLQRGFYALLNTIIPMTEPYPETEAEGACAVLRRVAKLLGRDELVIAPCRT